MRILFATCVCFLGMFPGPPVDVAGPPSDSRFLTPGYGLKNLGPEDDE